ncbi:helix-turn-helix transcriptional regulator [Myxococcus xanthus]|uniref:Helix-turn-helix transcriptional regulator n=1 Tax=Myxococcus xanthus TaxID=34 RepID=A0A7Y4IJJ8_MYXXA|nr:helix-turn-helix domain-containing protein [Myxococcus xanthus]NOJ80422.1 helix-turn-helix transcriptional regulator [Myxococcus xanthus]NOJ87474.1 helix-turn-helix transcriptional regulator [Myxococcus xanthus]
MAEGRLRSSQVHALVRLVRASREQREGRGERARHLLTGVFRILGAEAGACVLEHDVRQGGRRVFTAMVLEGWEGRARPALDALRTMGSDVNPAIRSMMSRPAMPGDVVTALRQELVGDRAWEGAPYVERYLRPAALDDSVYSTLWSTPPGVVQCIGVYRGRSGRPFDEADRELLHLFHTEWGALLGTSRPPAPVGHEARLSRRERQTLELVLAGLGDKQIAARLGISRFTVNQYTKSLYRRFAVHSRAALIVRLLGEDARGLWGEARGLDPGLMREAHGG